MSETTKRKVVITAMSAMTPVGNDIDQIVAACRNGQANFSSPSDTEDARATYVGLCSALDLSRLPDRKIKKVTTRKDLVGILTALKAAEGILPGSFDSERFGMFTGTPSTQMADLEPYFDLVLRSTQAEEWADRFGRELLGAVNPMVMMQTLMNNVLCYTAVALDIRGVNANFMDLQAAGFNALRAGFQALAYDRADIALIGGVSAAPDPLSGNEGVALGYLAGTALPSAQTIRPYDKDACGTILSEGSAFILLESLEHAKKRGAEILAVLDDVVVKSDGAFFAETLGPSRGLTASFCELETKQVFCGKGVVLASANGSKKRDDVEAASIHQGLKGQLEHCHISSCAAVTGELSEASSIMNTILAVDCLRKQRCLPTMNFSAQDPAAASLPIVQEEHACLLDYALVPMRSLSGICGVARLSPY